MISVGGRGGDPAPVRDVRDSARDLVPKGSDTMTTPPYGNDTNDADNPYASGPSLGTPQDSPDSPYGTSWHSPAAEAPVTRPAPTGASYAYTRGDALHGPYPAVPGSTDNDSAATPRPRRRRSEGGFFSALFDLNFEQFVSVKYAKFIYTLLLVLIGLALIFLWLVPAITAFREGILVGFAVLLLGWIPVAVVGLFQLIVVRILLEFVIATVRTSENTEKLREER